MTVSVSMSPRGRTPGFYRGYGEFFKWMYAYERLILPGSTHWQLLIIVKRPTDALFGVIDSSSIISIEAWRGVEVQPACSPTFFC